MSLTITPTQQGLYPVVHELARNIALETSSIMPDGSNCIDHALAAQEIFDNTIGEVSELQSASVDCGVIITIDGLSYDEDSKRFLHASNFIIASLGKRHAIVELDGYFKETSKIAATTDPVRLAKQDSFGHYSFAYGERRNKLCSWRSGITKNPRETPFRLNPFHDHKIVMGSNAGHIALVELRKASESQRFDKTRMPILLLSARA